MLSIDEVHKKVGPATRTFDSRARVACCASHWCVMHEQGAHVHRGNFETTKRVIMGLMICIKQLLVTNDSKVMFLFNCFATVIVSRNNFYDFPDFFIHSAEWHKIVLSIFITTHFLKFLKRRICTREYRQQASLSLHKIFPLKLQWLHTILINLQQVIFQKMGGKTYLQ